jgi:hypothetical protein
MNDDMHSTFLNNNEQIIADLAHLEMEQERQIFQIIYDTFKSVSGYAEFDDLCILAKTMGTEKDQVEDYCKQVNSEFDGLLDFDQFSEFLSKLDQGFVSKEQEKLNNDNIEMDRQEEEKKLDENIKQEKADGKDGDNAENKDLNEEVKQIDLDKVVTQTPQLADYKDNAIVPSNGVALTPDSRVVKLIKQLNIHFRNCEKDKEFGEAKVVKYKLEILKKKELKRQKDYLRANQEKELISIENSQKMQFYEFSQAWDTFMSDYEATAYLSLEKLKERHTIEMTDFQREFRESIESKIKYSKKVYDLKRRVEVLINMRNYEEADKYKMFLAKLEAEEHGQKVKELKKVSGKKEKQMKVLHQQQMAALLKRIQRDRNEQLKHRQKDSQKLIQRNRNILVDLLNKQNTEARRTGQYVQYTLGSTEDAPKKYYRAKIHYAPFVHKYKNCQTLNANKKGKAKPGKTDVKLNSQAKNDLEAHSHSESDSVEDNEEEREAVQLPLIE